MKHAEAIQTYLAEVGKLYKRPDATEHTYRPAFKTLMDAFSPAGVEAINEPKRERVGAPDFIVTKGKGRVPLGYVETKDIGKSLAKEARSEQLKRYRGGFHNLILTDYLEFWWYVGGEDKPRRKVMLATAGDNKKLKEDKKGTSELTELFKLFFQEQAPRATRAEDLAARMATVARIVRGLIEGVFRHEDESGNLHDQLEAFRDVLVRGLKEDEFADMYAQTIAYGLFAARCQVPESTYFDRYHAASQLPRTNPFLRKLFSDIAGEKLHRAVDWAVDELVYMLQCADMGAVLEDFGEKKGKSDPVIHFYETFLKAYDPKERKLRGVYYTPEPVVDYIVRSVDELLKTRFGKKAGLADESVLVLDPACGTGTFLQRVIELVYDRFKGNKGMWSEYVREKLLPRLFGFELLMAPYTMAHMKLAIKLKDTGYDFKEDERLNIFLTNTLEETASEGKTVPFAQYISDEGKAASGIKRTKPIMVVLGNPPYSNFGQMNKSPWILNLLKDYKKGLKEKKINLDDDFIKFIRFGQWRIDKTGSGILAYITNSTYTDGITRRQMRSSLLSSFTDIFILNLHGSSKPQEYCPDGSEDSNVFDIRQGVAVGIFVKEVGTTKPSSVHYRDSWGTQEAKYEKLLSEDVGKVEWNPLDPRSPNYFFVPRDTRAEAEYELGVRVSNAFPVHQNAIKTDRDALFFAWDQAQLTQRMQVFYSEGALEPAFIEKYHIQDSSSYDLLSRRTKTSFNPKNIRSCLYRPFDLRLIYYASGLTSRPAWKVMRHMLGHENLALLSCRQQAQTGFRHVLCTRHIAECCAVSLKTREITSLLPLYIYPEPGLTAEERALEQGKWHWPPGKDDRRPNLAPEFVEEFAKKLKLKFVTDGRGDLKKGFGPEDIFDYIYAVFHSPTYRSRYAEFLKIDFPRAPVTSSKPLFRKLVALGGKLVSLHLLETPELDDSEFRPHYPVEGDNAVEKPRYDEKQKRVYVNATQYFEPVEPETWEFQVGGYQVCQKWLKDRAKAGRTLSYDDLKHYAKTCAALRETIKLMADVDKAIPDWPIE